MKSLGSGDGGVDGELCEQIEKSHCIIIWIGGFVFHDLLVTIIDGFLLFHTPSSRTVPAAATVNF